MQFVLFVQNYIHLYIKSANVYSEYELHGEDMAFYKQNACILTGYEALGGCAGGRSGTACRPEER